VNVAVTVSVPTGARADVQDAVKFASVVEHRLITGELPVVNNTVPVGVPPPGAVTATATAYVTVVPKFTELGVADTFVMEVAALPTLSPKVVWELPRLPEPEYDAVMVSEPMGALGETQEPDPLPFRLAEHSRPLLVLKRTLPVGVGSPDPTDTVAE
jgi:hypothetical protein